MGILSDDAEWARLKAAQLHIRWSCLGVWPRAFEHLRDAGRSELGEVFPDSTSVRAHSKPQAPKVGGGQRPSAARAAATAPKPGPSAARAGARSASPCCRGRSPPEKLLRALLLQAFYSVRSERQLMEQLTYNMLFRWFVGPAMDAPVWDVTVFTKNRERLLRATSPAASCARS